MPLRDLLSSALAALLLIPDERRPAYFSSPWMSDFQLLDNRFGQHSALFPELGDKGWIGFVEYLIQLSRRRPVRVITVENETSNRFLSNLRSEKRVEVKFAAEKYHEKGILAPEFYIDGSMNITYSGVYVRGEKITYYTDSDSAGKDKITKAYLEFERRWSNLPTTTSPIQKR